MFVSKGTENCDLREVIEERNDIRCNYCMSTIAIGELIEL